MGLLRPTKGEINIDNSNLYSDEFPNKIFSWRNSIAHVPQNIFLTQGTIAENVAFGNQSTQIDMNKLLESIHLDIWKNVARLQWRPYVESKKFVNNLNL